MGHSMLLSGIHHVQITIPPELEEACRHFYAEVLGLPQIPKPANLAANRGAWYDLNGVELHVSLEKAAATGDSKRHVCYLVPDLTRVRHACESHGVTVIEDTQPIPEWKRFYVRDPAGNRLEFAERTRG